MARRAPHAAALIAALALAALALLAAAPARAAEPKASLPDIEDEVMCVECGTALNVSGSAVAERQREFIRRRIAEGQTKEQIKAALVAEFGPGVLATPPERGFNLAAYLVPPLLLLLAAVAIFTTGRRWKRAGDAARAPDADPSDEDRRRLERDMAAYDL